MGNVTRTKGKNLNKLEPDQGEPVSSSECTSGQPALFVLVAVQESNLMCLLTRKPLYMAEIAFITVIFRFSYLSCENINQWLPAVVLVTTQTAVRYRRNRLTGWFLMTIHSFLSTTMMIILSC